jgi:hypothetical protein
MPLLIDYLEEATAYLRERKEKLKRLDAQFRKIYDSDLKHEMAEIRREIAKKSGEVTTELLYNLEEFRALHKYFPELLQVYMEDEYIGRIISKKAWLLDYRPLPPAEAAARLNQLREWRSQLRDAKQYLKRWVGTVDAKAFAATYPLLKGHISGDMYKSDVEAQIDKVDKILLREGWLLLISDSLIQIPIAKFMTHINQLRFEEVQAKGEAVRARGRGTVAETAALRKFQSIQKKRLHYERALTQLLLANPGFLRAAKKKKNWLSREKAGNLERIIAGITPHTIKERVWLNEMKKKTGAEAVEHPPQEAITEPPSEEAPGKPPAAKKKAQRKKG